MSEKYPSAAQAKRLASIWSSHKPHASVMSQGRNGEAPYINPTLAAIIKRGWLVPCGDETSEFANGTKWIPHALTDSGVDALESYLRETRYRRQTPPPNDRQEASRQVR